MFVSWSMEHFRFSCEMPSELTRKPLFLLVASVICCACNVSSQRSAPPALLPLPTGGHLSPSGLPIEKVSLHASGRDAWHFPAGTACVDLNADPSATVLRVSVLPAEKGIVQLSAYQDGYGVAIAPATDAASWTTRSVPIEAGKSVHLVLTCATPFFLARCDLQESKPRRPDVLVYLVDTLRKDHLGPYNYPLDTSPNIKTFAKDGILFRDLTPMSSWTRPSVASLLTGTMDYTHHALSPEDHLPDGLPSLPKALQKSGWESH